MSAPSKHFVWAFIFAGILLFTPVLFSEEDPELPPRELIEEMLADEELPEEIKEELEEMLKSGEFDTSEEVPDEIAPPKEISLPLIEEEIEGVEEVEEPEEKLEAPKEIKAKPKSAAPAASDKISLDLKGVDIIDVLKMLSARSNLNIVAGRNVRGRVTLFLKDVNVWDAFEIILASNNLAYVKEGAIINVMTERDYEQLYGEKYYSKKELQVYKLKYAKASEVSKALNQAKSKIGKVIVDEASNSVVLIDSARSISKMEKMIKEMDEPIETKIFSLDYAKADDIKTKVTEVLTKGVGTIQVDERTNKVIVTDLSKNMPEIAKVIGEMDEKHQQVLIEAKIVEIELNDQYQYGVDWKAAFRSLGDQGFRISLDDFSGNVWTGTAGGTVTLASVASRNINGVIEMLRTIGKTNVISSPRITVLNNEEARVLVGTEQPVVTSTTTIPEGGQSITAENVTYLDVGVELTVTPTINKDGYVTMKIKPEISSLGTAIETARASGATGNLVYPVSKSETETTVMVKDGHTIVIAGLIQDRDIMEEDKIPILGDIPLLGNLFKNKIKGSTTQAEKEELVIFLTPYVISGEETFPEAENTWYGDTVTQRELLEQQMSLAVEDVQRSRSLVKRRPMPQRVEMEEDKTTRIAEDIDWVGDFKETGHRVRKELKEKLKLKEPGVRTDVSRDLPTPTNLIPPVIGGYYNYYEALRNRIYWIAKDGCPKDLKGKKENVRLAFTLTRDGRLIDEPQVLNKVDRNLAKAAIIAVEEAAPFPPFPRRMDKDSQVFKVTITYQ